MEELQLISIQCLAQPFFLCVIRPLFNLHTCQHIEDGKTKTNKKKNTLYLRGKTEIDL